MKINFEQVLCNFAGLPLKQGEEVITLKYAAVAALVAQYPDEPNLPGMEKFYRYQLAQKIYKGENSVSAEDITKIKTLIGKNFTSIVVGPAYDMLDGKVDVAPAELDTEPEANAELG